ncbi:hypothetical protein DAI22_02g043850 [Oryza sativa Japonica Group]|nr:hypothetical protein DAI22_02g043850 [Oryza sativa Japonica Group]
MFCGIVPLKLLSRRSKVCKLGRVEKLILESSPLKLLLLISMVLRFVQLLRVDGTSPYMLLWPKRSSSNFLSSPIDSGILPLKLFPPRSSVTRLLSFMICALSSVPFKPLLGTDRCSKEVALKSSSGRVPLRLF